MTTNRTKSKILLHVRYMLKDQICSTAITQPKIIKSFFYSIGILVEKRGDGYTVRHFKTQIGDSIVAPSIKSREDFLRAFFMELYNSKIKNIMPDMEIKHDGAAADSVQFLTFCSTKLGWMYENIKL